MNICPSHPHWVLEHSRDQSSSKHDFTTGKTAFMILIGQRCSHISEFDKAPLTGFVLWYRQARRRSLMLWCIYSSRCGFVCWSLQWQRGILTLTHGCQEQTFMLPSLCILYAPWHSWSLSSGCLFFPKPHLLLISPLPLICTKQTLY